MRLIHSILESTFSLIYKIMLDEETCSRNLGQKTYSRNVTFPVELMVNGHTENDETIRISLFDQIGRPDLGYVRNEFAGWLAGAGLVEVHDLLLCGIE